MGDRLKSIGMHIARYGLAIVLLWIGGMMLTAYQAEGIRPLVANSPLMSWVYRVMSVGGFSSLLGVVEIAIGVLIALRPVWPRGSAVGSALASGMFLTTLGFLVTTPGWEPSLGGFPALSALPGQSLLKDIVRLGASLFTAGESLGAAGSRRGTLPHDGAREVRRREAFRVRAVDGGERGVGLVAAAVPLPEPGQAHRGPQFPAPALLAPGRLDGLAEAALRPGLVGRLGQQQLTLEAVKL